MACRKKRKKSFDLISIGDSTEDIFTKIEEAKIICDMDEDYCWICLEHPGSTDISNLERTIAGNSANVAVGISRFGLNSGFYTILGCDESGRAIKSALKKEGVDVKFVENAKNCETNSTVVINFKAERTQLLYQQKRDYKLPKLPKSEWIYLSAMGEGCDEIYPELEKYLLKHNVKLGFNPGGQQLEDGIKSYGRLLDLCTVIFINKQEARELFNHQKKKSFVNLNEEMIYLLNIVRETGPEIVVITDGKKGAFAFDGKDYWHMPVHPTQAIEMTGAGDSFSAGVLAGLMCNKSLAESLLFGSCNASSVIKQIGPQKGLLTRRQLLAIIKKESINKAIKIK